MFRTLSAVAIVGLCGCNTLETYTAGFSAATVVGGQSPSHEISQIFYVGSFDPQGQLPPELYRIRVHGQASFISTVDFASGWVKAELIDSLGTTISSGKKGSPPGLQQKSDLVDSKFETGRRLMQFGPEGFRKVPKDHRLVIVMGSDPGEYFDAMNNALALVQNRLKTQSAAGLQSELLSELVRVEAERRALEAVQATAAGHLAKKGG